VLSAAAVHAGERGSGAGMSGYGPTDFLFYRRGLTTGRRACQTQRPARRTRPARSLGFAAARGRFRCAGLLVRTPLAVPLRWLRHTVANPGSYC
jgi:hypothetical protein